MIYDTVSIIIIQGGHSARSTRPSTLPRRSPLQVESFEISISECFGDQLWKVEPRLYFKGPCGGAEHRKKGNWPVMDQAKRRIKVLVKLDVPFLKSLAVVSYHWVFVLVCLRLRALFVMHCRCPFTHTPTAHVQTLWSESIITDYHLYPITDCTEDLWILCIKVWNLTSQNKVLPQTLTELMRNRNNRDQNWPDA